MKCIDEIKSLNCRVIKKILSEATILNSLSMEFSEGFCGINFFLTFFLLHYPHYFSSYEEFPLAKYNRLYIITVLSLWHKSDLCQNAIDILL